MAIVSEPERLSGEPVSRVTIGIRQWMRLLAGALGALLCAAGAAVAVFPFPDVPELFLFAKFALGVMIFVAGFALARSGARAPASELHYDPEYGEFILVPVDEGWEAAQCVMSTKSSKIDVSGRHLTLASNNDRLRIHLALRDADTALNVSRTCQPDSKAA